MSNIVYLTINQPKEELFKQTGDKTYETTHYIGSTTLDNTKYFGSSKWLTNDIKKWGIDGFKRYILFSLINDDPNILLEYEKQIQIDNDVVNSNRFYNKVLATERFTPADFIWYHNPKSLEKGRFHKTNKPPIGWIKGSGFSTIKNKKAYHNKISKQISFFKKDKIPGKDWIMGLPIGNTIGKIWYHNVNDLKQRGCYKENTQPVGWIKGMGDTSNHPRIKDNWVSYYNPTTMLEKHFIEGNEFDGWIRGSLKKPRLNQKWYHNPNNPIERRFFNPNDIIPIGWIKGKGFKSGGRPKGSKNKSKKRINSILT